MRPRNYESRRSLILQMYRQMLVLFCGKANVHSPFRNTLLCTNVALPQLFSTGKELVKGLLVLHTSTFNHATRQHVMGYHCADAAIWTHAS
jgi:hypothetical protein